MRLIVGSAKHSPGATTLAVAVACVVAEEGDDGPPVLVEADPAGGDLAARLGLPSETGLSTLAAAGRHGHEAGLLWRHAHPLPAGGAVVLAPTEATQCRSALSTLGPRLGAMVTDEAVDCVLDVGRMTDGFNAALHRGCDAIVVACRPDLAGIEHTRLLVSGLQRAQDLDLPIVVVTIGERPYGPADVRLVLPSVVATSVPFDPNGAAALLSGPPRRARRTALARSVCSLLDDLVGATT